MTGAKTTQDQPRWFYVEIEEGASAPTAHGPFTSMREGQRVMKATIGRVAWRPGWLDARSLAWTTRFFRKEVPVGAWLVREGAPHLPGTLLGAITHLKQRRAKDLEVLTPIERALNAAVRDLHALPGEPTGDPPGCTCGGNPASYCRACLEERVQGGPL